MLELQAQVDGWAAQAGRQAVWRGDGNSRASAEPRRRGPAARAQPHPTTAGQREPSQLEASRLNTWLNDLLITYSMRTLAVPGGGEEVGCG